MSVTTSVGSAGARRSARSSTLAIASATGFLILSGLLSFVPEAPSGFGEGWRLRGPLAEQPDRAGVAGLRKAPKPV